MTIVYFQDREVLHVLGQIVMGGYFIFQGTRNALKPAMVVGRLREFGLPLPRVTLWVGILMMYAGGALLVADLHVRTGAVILFAFTFLATVIFQRWWTVKDPVRRPYNNLMFCYNVFIMGALLLLM